MDEQRKLPFVWELEYNGVRSYVAGTLHNEKSEEYVEDARARLDGIEQVLLEIHPSRLYIPEITEPIEQAKERFNKLDCTERAALMPLIRIVFGKNAEMFIESDLQRRTPSISGVDGAIYHAASDLRLPVHGIETDDEHGRAVKEAFGKYTIEFMKGLASEPATIGFVIGALESLIHCYRKGNEDKFGFLSSFDGSKDDLRNRTMVERSSQYLAKPSLIAVGTGHLIGKEPTMLDIYKKEGIKVKRI